MSKARDIMHRGVECIGENETIEMAARKMRELHVGSLPICGKDNRMHGILTDRDIVVRCIAEGRDPRTTMAGELAQGTPVWVKADADEAEVLQVMAKHKIRRLPVLEDRHLVGIISEADLITRVGHDRVAEFVTAVYSAAPNL